MNAQFRILQAFAIILVVLGHVNEPVRGFDKFFHIYSYHMALFMFISGYFFKEDNAINIRQYSLKKIKHLVIPYFIYNLIYGIINTSLKAKGIITYGEDLNLKSFFIESWITGHQYIFNLATWFVLTLFITEIAYAGLYKSTRRYNVHNSKYLSITLLLIGIIVMALSKHGCFYNDTFTKAPILLPVFRVLFFLPFFHIGFLYKTHYEEKDSENIFIKLICLISCIVLIHTVSGDLFPIDYDYVAAFMDFRGHYITPYITSFIGIFTWLYISKLLSKYKVVNNAVVRKIGECSWDIMAHHLFILFLINYFLSTRNFNDFDYETFRNTIWYTYTLGSKYQLIIYYILAISIPVFIRFIIDISKNKISQILKMRKQ